MGFEMLPALSILPDSLALLGLGQSGVIVKGPDAIIAIDPYLSDYVTDISSGLLKRDFPPPVLPEALTGVDYILCTHDHADHFDPLTVVPMLAVSPGAKLVLPGWAVDHALSTGIDASRLIVPNEPLTLPNTSLRLTVVPSAHYGRDYDPDKGYRWLGFHIEWNGVTLYHAGDTIIYDGYVDTLRALPTPDLALVPVNGRDWFREQTNLLGNLTPTEAVRLAAQLGWDTLVPLHNDMFASNHVPWAEFAQALETFAPRQRYKYIQPGELFYFVKS